MFDITKWVLATQLLFPLGPPPYPVFFNTYTGDGVTVPWNGKTFAKGAWTRVDISDMVPADTKGVCLSGIMIVTHGTTEETADLTINLKPPGSTENPLNYEGQVIEASIGNGQRSPFYSCVAVEGQKFDFYWNSNTPGTWPTNSSYGLSLQIQVIAR